jgi:autotransporter-associated beta strand protein
MTVNSDGWGYLGVGRGVYGTDLPGGVPEDSIAKGEINLSGGDSEERGAKLTVNCNTILGVVGFSQGDLNISEYADFETTSGSNLIVGQNWFDSTERGVGNVTVTDHGKLTVGQTLIIAQNVGADGNVTLEDDSTAVASGNVLIAQNAGSRGNLTLKDQSHLTTPQIQSSAFGGGETSITLSGDAVLEVTGYSGLSYGWYDSETSEGQSGGKTTLTMSGNARYTGSHGHLGGTHSNQIYTNEVTLSGNSSIEFTSFVNLGGTGSKCSVNMYDDASITGASCDFGWGMSVLSGSTVATNTTGVLNQRSSITTTTGDFNIGVHNGTGSGTLNDSSKLTVGRDLNIGSFGDDSLRSNGSLTLNENPVSEESDPLINVTRDALIGYQYGDATVTMTGGTINVTRNAHFGCNYGDATVTMTGGTIAVTGWIAIANIANATGEVTLSGDSSISAGTWLAVGNAYDGNGSGEMFLSGNATASAGVRLEVAYGGTGVVNIGNGVETDDAVFSSTNPLALGWGTSSEDTHATINLNAGGTLETAGIITGHDYEVVGALESVVNFNGGVLKATADDAPADGDTPAVPFISNEEWDNVAIEKWQGGSQDFRLMVQAGGAVIDTNGHDISSTEPFIEDSESTGGGLTKLGEGTFTLTGGPNTYTGDTHVVDGVLSITDDEMLADGGDLWIEEGAVLDLDFSGTETIDSLLLDDVGQVTGTWGANGSGADNVNDTYFSGLGVLYVSSLYSAIPGDTNDDHVVDEFDAAVLADHWGHTGLTGKASVGDFNEDGTVNVLDAAILAANWTGPSEATATPEPSSAILLLIGLAGALFSRRRSR